MILGAAKSILERIATGGGWYLTGFGMGVVFLGLIILSSMMYVFMKFMTNLKERENRKEILKKISSLAMRRATLEVPFGPENTADVNDEVVAAITLALKTYYTLYEDPNEDFKLTQIKKVTPVSPWKIYYRSQALQRSANRFKR